MKFEKVNSYEIEKCYAVEHIIIDGKDHIIAASEKDNKCCLFEAGGKFVEDIWYHPGGTMSLVAPEEREGVFLASQKFYGPDDSKDSVIVYAERMKEGKWELSNIMQLPHLHRFDIIKRNGISYLIACTIKENSQFENDWRTKGRIYTAELPDKIDKLGLDELPLQLTKNHGYRRMEENGYDYSLITGDEGVYKVVPPLNQVGEWSINRVLESPVSDAVYIDLDGDGEMELLTIEPFHGDEVCLYKKIHNKLEKISSFKAEFAHAIWAGYIYGKPIVLLGYRKGRGELLMLSMDSDLKIEVIDRGTGPANVICYEYQNCFYIASANRESDHIGFYRIIE